jgi:PAS domain S-box-containing protein
MEAQLDNSALRFVADASKVLASSLDYETTLSSIARLAVPGMADWCSVDMLDDHGAIHRLAVAHVDPTKVEWAHDLQRRYPPDPNADSGVPKVLRTGEPEFYPDIPDEMLVEAAKGDDELLRIIREIGFRSVITVPLLARGRALGAITFVRTNESETGYTPQHLSLAEELAMHAALAVDNSRLYQEAQAVQKRYRLLADAMPQIVWTALPDGRIDYFNARWFEYTGLGLEESLAGVGWDTVIHPEDRDRVIENWAQSVAAQTGQDAEMRLRRISDGAYRWHLGRSIAVRGVDGRVTHWVGTCTDIDDQKRAEQEAEARAHREGLVSQISLAVRTSMDPNEIIGLAQATLAECLGADRCYFSSFDYSRDIATVWQDWRRDGLSSVAGSYPISKLPDGPEKRYPGGATLVANDVGENPNLSHSASFLVKLGIRSIVSVPMYGEGRVIAALGVAMADSPREWAKDEVALIEEVATLTRTAAELAGAEQSRRRVLRDVLFSVTEGKLRLCSDSSDLPQKKSSFEKPVPLSHRDTMALRTITCEAAQKARMPDERLWDLTTAVGEAAMNAVIHAGGGEGSVFVSPQGMIQVWVADQGAGIAFDSLHEATLRRGFTTAGTFGHGFWMMLNTVDRIWLLTGPSGTVVVLEQDRVKPDTFWQHIETPRPRAGKRRVRV